MYTKRLRFSSVWAPLIPHLSAPEPLGLNLRESDLDTHDLTIPLTQGLDNKTTTKVITPRSLLILLLTPSDITSRNGTSHASLPLKLERFAALTGGVNVLVFILLAPTPAASPLHAYMALQASALSNPTTALLPILPLANPEVLKSSISHYISALAPPKPESLMPPVQAARQGITTLLPYVTSTSEPLPEHAVYLLSDAFSGLADLAAAAVEGGEGEGEGRVRECFEEGERGAGAAAGVLDFWREEWVVD